MPLLYQGSAWWFNDNKTGMREQLTSLANLSALGCFPGMLTDSRSLVSYPRHEYFRRIFCNLVGEWPSRASCLPTPTHWRNWLWTSATITSSVCSADGETKEYVSFL